MNFPLRTTTHTDPRSATQPFNILSKQWFGTESAQQQAAHQASEGRRTTIRQNDYPKPQKGEYAPRKCISDFQYPWDIVSRPKTIFHGVFLGIFKRLFTRA
ncbi:hypothetical protein [Delftia acidovorans]|uniref:hypothetical protein n=1 Tax=Delftia acidovorans TaxID=80866 RepID=UPI003D14E8B9